MIQTKKSFYCDFGFWIFKISFQSLNYFHFGSHVRKVLATNIFTATDYQYSQELRFCQKSTIICKNTCVNGWWNWHQPSISSALYPFVFCTNVVSAAFSTYMQVEKAAKTMFIQKNKKGLIHTWHFFTRYCDKKIILSHWCL